MQEVQRQMEFLLEEYFFSEEDIQLNANTLLWPRNIGPIFDINDEVNVHHLEVFLCTLGRRLSPS